MIFTCFFCTLKTYYVMGLSLQQLANFYECSTRTAQLRKKEIIDGLGLRRKRVEIYDLCKYEGVKYGAAKVMVNGEFCDDIDF